MHGLFTYIWVVLGVNAGKYTIQSGIWNIILEDMLQKFRTKMPNMAQQKDPRSIDCYENFLTPPVDIFLFVLMKKPGTPWLEGSI